MNQLTLFMMNNKDLHVLFLCRYGSHLYGTSTPKSDEDFKGVFLPSIEQCILGQVPKSISYHSGNSEGKNETDDVDIEMYSLQFFLKLLQRGDTGALDMLHAPLDDPNIVICRTDIWKYLHAHRADFYTKNLSAFVGYCRTQASKYGIKGSRLNAAKEVLDFLKADMGGGHYDPDRRLKEVWDALPSGEHTHFIDADPEQGKQFRCYQVCGKKLQETVTIEYAIGVISKFYDAYGKRAELAAENRGIDWKALSHAMRCGYEMQQLYSEGDITFPLKKADRLLAIKKGECDYTTDVAPALELVMMEVEKHAANSIYPNKVDIKRFEEWLVKIYSFPGKESLTLHPVHTSSEAIAMRNNAIGLGK